MAQKLHARPNLEHLKKQAKALVAKRPKGFKLADAQLELAREAGFPSWPKLVRHVEQLRALEGEWAFASLEIDGADIDPAGFSTSRLLMDGYRFRMSSDALDYDGVFDIDVDATPHTIDIEFVEGPEAGNTALGIFEAHGEQLTICLGLVGSSRPLAFKTTKGSGHALEKLRRVSKARPDGVTGGSKTAESEESSPVVEVDSAAFDVAMTPFIRQMEGEWKPTALIRDGEPMNEQWLSFGSRTATGNEVKVVFGGQTMVHAKVRVDETAMPIAIDYLGLAGSAKGEISLGIVEWAGAELRVNMAPPGKPRPSDFTSVKGSGRTLSQWKKI